MAQVEPMDIDAIESDFDNKENTFHHSNVLSRTPCTEKGYEELDVSELNMKLRYSITPASSPMSKSFTGPLDSRNHNMAGDYINDVVETENGNLTRSLNSTLTKNESVSKCKVLPLQTLSAEPFGDSNRNPCTRRLLDPVDNNNITISLCTNDIDENLSLPSTSSSMAQTPEATTPTKEIPKPEGSPILRGLKSVLSMFRPSQSPIPLADDRLPSQDILSPIESQQPISLKNETDKQLVLASTPVSANRQKDTSSSRRSSPLKESVVFNDDLERDLLWKDETTIIFKDEKIPVHKLFFRNPLTPEASREAVTKHLTTVECMNISSNEPFVADKLQADNELSSHLLKNDGAIPMESDNEFMDCETTFTQNESHIADHVELKQESMNKVISNLTMDLAEGSRTPGVNESEFRNIINSEGVKPEEGDVESLQQVSISTTDFSIETDSKPSDIIEVAQNLTTSLGKESIDINFTQTPLVSKNLHSESQIPNDKIQPDEVSEKETVDDKITMIKDNIQDFPQVSTIIDNCNVTDRNENPIYNEVTCEFPSKVDKIESLTDLCTLISNSNDYSKDIPVDDIEIKENSELISIIKDVEVTKDVLTDDLTIDTGAINVKSLDVIPSLSNNEKIYVVNLEQTEVEQIEKKKKLLPPNNDNPVAVESSVPVQQIEKNVTLSPPNNNNPVAVESSVPVHDKSLYVMSSKSNCDNLITHCLPITVLNEDEISVNVKEIVGTNLITNSSELNIEPTITNIETNSNHLNFNNTFEKHDHNDISDSLDANGKYSLTNTENEILQNIVQTANIPPNIALIGNDCDVSLHPIQNDISIGISPSDIPLPEENDIEQGLTESNNIVLRADTNQDVTFNICDENSILHADNTKKSLDTIKTFEHTIISQNLVEEDLNICPTDILYEQNTDIQVTKPKLFEHGTEINDGDNITKSKIRTSPTPDSPNQSSNFEKEYTHIDINTNATKFFDLLNLHNDNQTTVDPSTDPSLQTIETLEPPELHSIANKCEIDNMIDENNMDQKEEDKIFENGIITDNVPEVSAASTQQSDVNLVKTKNSEDINMLENSEVKTEVSKNILSVNEQIKDGEEIDEEIITSANNSPYVSVQDLALDAEPNLKDILNNNLFATKTKVAFSPPISPKIASKGYNFNFDDIDDPFATKSKIRTSPTPDSPNRSSGLEKEFKEETLEEPKKVNNKRKALTERKRSSQKKNLNSTVTGQMCNKENVSKKSQKSGLSTPRDRNLDNMSTSVLLQNIQDLEPEQCDMARDTESVSHSVEEKIDDTYESNLLTLNVSSVKNDEIHPIQGETKCIEALVVSNDKSTSSSEQYFSLGTSSGESSLMNRSKNVFNLPEIDDRNFTPFATKSNMALSPQLSIQNDAGSAPDTKNSAIVLEQGIIKDTGLGVHTFSKVSTKDTSPNTSSATSFSNDPIVSEVLTEDDDTIEGPFLEVDNLNNNDKLTAMDIESDMMNFDELTPQDKDLNLENGELFIDADAYEFLINQNKSATVLDSGKESLFLKFDPLFAKRISSDGVLAALSKVQKRQSTPKKIAECSQKNANNIEKSVAGSSNEKYVPVEEYNEDLTTMTKPMMVVSPAVSSVVSSRKSTTPPNINRRSLTFTSPAMAVIDRLLSLSGNSSHLNHDTSIPFASRGHTETDLAITQLRELLAEKEIHVHNLRSESKELKDRLSVLEGQVRSLESESSERLTKINQMNERLLEKTKMNKSMATVVEEYERTIASLISETEQDKKRNAKERMMLIKERDEQTAHLTSMEVSFNDLHSKYEKSKQIILSCKANEEMYKKSLNEFEANFLKMQNNYELLKQHATSKLNHANQELEKMNRAHETEVLKLNAMIKRKELHITSLEETLSQKTKANEELTAICDELINKVG